MAANAANLAADRQIESRAMVNFARQNRFLNHKSSPRILVGVR
jgi:hypothetical protein